MYDVFEDEQNIEYSDDLYNDEEELDFSHKESDDILELNNLPEIAAIEITPDDNSLQAALRSELKKKLECSRKKFKVSYDGKIYSRPPVCELKSGKFLFEICGKLVGVTVSDIMV